MDSLIEIIGAHTANGPVNQNYHLIIMKYLFLLILKWIPMQ